MRVWCLVLQSVRLIRVSLSLRYGERATDADPVLEGANLKKAWIKSGRTSTSGADQLENDADDPEATGPDTPSPDMAMVELVRHSPPRLIWGGTKG